MNSTNPENYQLDKLDQKILSALSADGRLAYTDLGDRLKVSAGTIHVRINKMREAGIVQGTRIVFDAKKVGLAISSFIGIKLHNARDYRRVIEKIIKLDAVTEASYTTGPYNIFIRVYLPSIEELHGFLLNELQRIDEIQSTETLVVLDEPLSRAIPVEKSGLKTE